MLARRERRQLRYAGASTASRGAQGCKCFAAAAAFVVGSGGPSPCSLDASVASFVTLAFSTALRGAGLQVHCCSRCLRRRLWWAVAVLAQCERCQLRYAGVSTAVRGAQGCKCFAAAAYFVVGSGVWAVAVLARRERCQLRYAGISTASCGAGLQVLRCSRCLRRRLRCGPSPCSLDASVASFVTLAFPPLRAVPGCKCFAAAAASVVGSDGPSPCSLYACVASLVTLAFPPLCAVPGCKCFTAAAAVRRRL